MKNINNFNGLCSNLLICSMKIVHSVTVSRVLRYNVVMRLQYGKADNNVVYIV
jgi:hypothetical protein